MTSAEDTAEVSAAVRSVLAPAAVAALVARDYGGPVDACVLHSVRLHDHYLVERGGERSLLRVYEVGHAARQADAAGRLFELELLTHLDREGTPVAAPCARADGGLQGSVAAPEGERLVALFPLLEGSPAIPPDAAQARRAGEAVAALHLAATGYRGEAAPPALDLERLLEGPLARLRAALAGRRPDDAAFLEDLAAEIREGAPPPSPDPEVLGPVGGGFTFDNHHWVPDRGPAFFGFGQAGRSWRAYDVAIYLWNAALLGLPPEVPEAFVAGYDAVRPLAAPERAALPCLTKLRMLQTMGLHVELTRSMGTAFQDDAYWERHLGPLRAWGHA